MNDTLTNEQISKFLSLALQIYIKKTEIALLVYPSKSHIERIYFSLFFLYSLTGISIILIFLLWLAIYIFFHIRTYEFGQYVFPKKIFRGTLSLTLENRHIRDLSLSNIRPVQTYLYFFSLEQTQIMQAISAHVQCSQ